jgi:hypothetical protein
VAHRQGRRAFCGPASDGQEHDFRIQPVEVARREQPGTVTGAQREHHASWPDRKQPRLCDERRRPLSAQDRQLDALEVPRQQLRHTAMHDVRIRDPHGQNFPQSPQSPRIESVHTALYHQIGKIGPVADDELQAIMWCVIVEDLCQPSCEKRCARRAAQEIGAGVNAV